MGNENNRNKWGVYESDMTENVAVCKVSEVHLHELWSEKCECRPGVEVVFDRKMIKHREMVADE